MKKRPLQQTACLPQGLLLMFLMVLLTSCTTTPFLATPSPESNNLWQQRQLMMAGLQSWTFKGRVAVKNTSDSMSANIQWTQQLDRSDINFSNLFGLRMARLQIDSDEAILKMRDDRELTGLDATSLLDAHFGWSIPVNGLRYWVLGLPDADNGKQEILDNMGRLHILVQSGWHIEYSRFSEFEGMDLPKKITLNRDNFRIRLIIDHWEAEKVRIPVCIPTHTPFSNGEV